LLPPVPPEFGFKVGKGLQWLSRVAISLDRVAGLDRKDALGLEAMRDTISDSPGAALVAVSTILGVIRFADSENYCGS